MSHNLPMRSLMFVPGHNQKLLKNAVKTDADVLLIDLEDSVQPNVNKQIARENILDFIREGYFVDYAIFPRVNDRESGELLKDVTQLSVVGVSGFVYPKAKTGEDIYFFDKLLETIEYEKGFEIGMFKIIALIETASAVLNAEEICGASGRVIAIAFGNEDFLTDIQGFNDEEASTLFTPRAMIAMAARSKNVIPIDTVHIDVHNLESLERNIVIAKKLGYEGMLVLNPKEIEIVHKHYTPSFEEVLYAKEIVENYEKAKKTGVGVAMVNGKFIGPPLAKKAYAVLNKYNALTSKNKISMGEYKFNEGNYSHTTF